MTALPLYSVFEPDVRARQRCAWPECASDADSRGLCGRHYVKVYRHGRTVGCETKREELVATALAVFAAEGDADFDRAVDDLEALVERRAAALVLERDRRAKSARAAHARRREAASR